MPGHPQGIETTFDNLYRKARREELANRVRRDEGFAQLDGDDFYLAVADSYFPNSAAEKLIEIRSELLDCCADIVDTIMSGHIIQRDLKMILANLRYLEGACQRTHQRGRQPAQSISGLTFQILSGHLPDRLKPQFQSVFPWTEFGNMIATRYQGNPKNRYQTSLDSERMAGAFDFLSAADSCFHFDTITKSAWPAVLTAFGFRDEEEPPAELRVYIRQLSEERRAELLRLVQEADERLKGLFRIRSKHDPLMINPSNIFYQPPLAKLMNGLCELVAPFPAVKGLESYELIYKSLPWQSLPKLLETLLQHIIKQVTRTLQAQRPRDNIAKDVHHLLTIADVPGHDAEFEGELVRMTQRFITCHRQIAILHDIRTKMEPALEHIDFGSNRETDFAGMHVTWQDFHNLGRWTDVLRGRLKSGFVDSRRQEIGRDPLPPEFNHWQWPEETPMMTETTLYAPALVKAARRSFEAQSETEAFPFK